MTDTNPAARHPMLDARPVMIGDPMIADDPDGPDKIVFHVGSLHYDSSPRPPAEARGGLPAGEPWGWTVRPVEDDLDDFEWPVDECERHEPLPEPPDLDTLPIVVMPDSGILMLRPGQYLVDGLAVYTKDRYDTDYPPEPLRVGIIGATPNPARLASDLFLARRHDCYRCASEARAVAEATGEPSMETLMITSGRMFLCPTCGNKRCPKATDHRQTCTGSNASGQPGSGYL